MNQDDVEDVVIPTEIITHSTALLSSTSAIMNLNTTSKFSNYQTVLLQQTHYTKLMPPLLTRKPTYAHKLTHRLLLKEHLHNKFLRMPMTFLLYLKVQKRNNVFNHEMLLENQLRMKKFCQRTLQN